jgi:hypothetical protein
MHILVSPSERIPNCFFFLKRKLCEAPYNKTLDWSKWYIFWAEERAVAKNHAESNYKLAKEEFISKVYLLNICPLFILHAVYKSQHDMLNSCICCICSLFHRAYVPTNFHSSYVLLQVILLCLQQNHVTYFNRSS